MLIFMQAGDIVVQLLKRAPVDPDNLPTWEVHFRDVVTGATTQASFTDKVLAARVVARWIVANDDPADAMDDGIHALLSIPRIWMFLP